MNSTAIVLSNSKLLVNINYYGFIKDFYFPNVGEENHLASNINPYYIFLNNENIEVNEENFEFNIQYISDSTIALIQIKDKKQRFIIEFKYFIHNKERIFFNQILISNTCNEVLNIKLIFENNFSLLESNFSDTITWFQPYGYLWQYKNNRNIAIFSNKQFYQFSCYSKTDNFNLLNTNGELDFNPVSTGNVLSYLSLKFDLLPNKTIKRNLYYACSKTHSKLNELVKKSKKINLEVYKNKIAINDSQYLDKYIDLKRINKLKDHFDNNILKKTISVYERSLLIIKSQTNYNGLLIAANDGQFLKNDGVDHYSYFWPRDAALIASIYLELNDLDTFEFLMINSLALLDNKGYFYHKYFPSANKKNIKLGSSWHSYFNESGVEILPIQLDSTLLWLYYLIQYFNKVKEYNKKQNAYKYIKKILKFLLKFNFNNRIIYSNINEYFNGFNSLNGNFDFNQYENTNLPLPSFDIWEQYYGVFTYNSILAYLSLKKSLKIFETISDINLKNSINEYIIKLKEDINKYLLINNKYIKGIRYDKDSNKVIKDFDKDSSILIAMLLDSDNEFDFSNTLKELDDSLSINNNIGGYARKENDSYLSINNKYTGNPWYITTMLRARVALKYNDIDRAKQILYWVLSHIDKTEIISEQVNPINGFSLGVKPLTWSHAEYIKLLNSFSCYL